MPPTQITAARMWTASPTTMVVSLIARRLDPAAVLGRRFDQPLPHRLSIGAGDVELEAWRLVDGMKERPDMAEQALRAGADRKRAGMKIDGAAFDEQVAAARPGNAQRGAAAAEIDGRGHGPGEGIAEQRHEVAIAAFRLDDEPALGADPEDRRRAARRRTICRRIRRDAEHCGQRIAHDPVLFGTRGDLDDCERATLGENDTGTG